MTLQKEDWIKLQPAIITLIISILAAFACVWYVMGLSEKSLTEAQNQDNQLAQARQKFQSAGVEKSTISQYLPQYQSLIKQGFIGEEKRIEWIDTLRNIHQQKKMFSIDYNIEKQTDYTPPFPTNLGSLKLHRSIMNVELSMLHEGDILTLLDALKTEQSAPFIVRSCIITRNTANVELKFVPNLSAKCALDWLTLVEPAELEEAKS